eukprot:TRINITY_DN68068_c4_g3_i1.p1 TRINITY_DN68068_c4_g3~~TRINITY_DN68068_c4_g3_i1.p1  ORF type:complete len:275 (-),score=5.34 TRINITY_DN68068_c4_g3_i1:965-1789(-)
MRWLSVPWKRNDKASKNNGEWTEEQYVQELLNPARHKWDELQMIGYKNQIKEGALRMWKRAKAPVLSCDCVKFTAFIPNVTPADVVAHIYDPAKRTWDPNYSIFREVKRLGEDCRVVYCRTAVPKALQFIAAPREFVQRYKLRHIDNSGRYVVTCQSISEADQEFKQPDSLAHHIPELNGAVRAHMYFQGTLVEPKVKGDIEGTQVTVMTCGDFKFSEALRQIKLLVTRKYPLRWYSHLKSALPLSKQSIADHMDSWLAALPPCLMRVEYMDTL